MKILVIGDFHIPDRENSIPSEIWLEIQDFTFDLILCTGDLTDPKLLDQLKSLAPVKVISGNMDYWFGLRNLPRSLVINLKNCTIGLIHGNGIRPRGNHDQLSHIAKEMQVDILISGHTHAQSVKKYNDVLLINPGSATGSWGGGPSSGIPSFIILEEKEDILKIESIMLRKGKLQHQHSMYNITTRTLE